MFQKRLAFASCSQLGGGHTSDPIRDIADRSLGLGLSENGSIFGSPLLLGHTPLGISTEILGHLPGLLSLVNSDLHLLSLFIPQMLEALLSSWILCCCLKFGKYLKGKVMMNNRFASLHFPSLQDFGLSRPYCLDIFLMFSKTFSSFLLQESWSATS